MKVLISPWTRALTVLKSEDVTFVSPNNASICSGPTAIYRGIEGSTDAKSSVFLAVLNFATVKSVPPFAI